MRLGWIAAAGAALCAMTLAGCGSGSAVTMTQNPVTPAATSAPHGEAYGGQQPVQQMSLQLYDAGKSGYGSAATGLFGTEPKTGSDGSFTFPSYSCPNANDEVYLVGTGASPSQVVLGACPIRISP